MKDIESLLQIMRNSRLPMSEHCHLLDDIIAEDYAYHKNWGARIDPDEKILFAVGGINDKRFRLSTIKPICITNKKLYIKAWSIFETNYQIAIEDIKSIRVGKAVYCKNTYEGHRIYINEEEVARVNMFFGVSEHSDPVTQRIIRYVFDIIAGEYTEKKLREELSKWDNAPEKQLQRPDSFTTYIARCILTFGLHSFIEMHRCSRKLNTITAKQEYEPLTNYLVTLLFSIPTAGIIGLIWRSHFLNRMEQELKRRDLLEGVRFSAAKTWLLGFVSYALIMAAIVYTAIIQDGSLLFGGIIGIIIQLVFRNRILKYMSILVDDYNMKG